MTGLTDARYSVDLNSGIFENTPFNNGSINKNFEVNDEDFNLSLKQDKKNKNISVQIDTIGSDSDKQFPIVNIIPIDINKFKVILPNGEEKFFLAEGDKIIEVTESDNLIINTFIPQNTDKKRVNLNNFSISLYLCAFFIMVFMIFDDYYGIRAIYRLSFQSLIVLLMIFI